MSVAASGGRRRFESRRKAAGQTFDRRLRLLHLSAIGWRRGNPDCLAIAVDAHATQCRYGVSRQALRTNAVRLLCVFAENLRVGIEAIQQNVAGHRTAADWLHVAAARAGERERVARVDDETVIHRVGRIHRSDCQRLNAAGGANRRADTGHGLYLNTGFAFLAERKEAPEEQWCVSLHDHTNVLGSGAARLSACRCIVADRIHDAE